MLKLADFGLSRTVDDKGNVSPYARPECRNRTFNAAQYRAPIVPPDLGTCVKGGVRQVNSVSEPLASMGRRNSAVRVPKDTSGATRLSCVHCSHIFFREVRNLSSD